MKKLIITFSAIASLIVGGIVLQSDEKIELQDPQVLVWIKPTTDLEWAEDVKKENFDIKTDLELETMIISHRSKLERLLNNFREYTECPECVKFRIKLNGEVDGGLSQQDIDNAFQNEYNARLRKIEKITQSIERMEKELELRVKGIVIR